MHRKRSRNTRRMRGGCETQQARRRFEVYKKSKHYAVAPQRQRDPNDKAEQRNRQASATPRSILIHAVVVVVVVVIVILRAAHDGVDRVERSALQAHELRIRLACEATASSDINIPHGQPPPTNESRGRCFAASFQTLRRGHRVQHARRWLHPCAAYTGRRSSCSCCRSRRGSHL